MLDTRGAGVLCHISSLPGAYGIGSLGHEAYAFADLLVEGGFSYWQVLPIGPVVSPYHFSPYSSPSTFAGNYLFISLEKCAEKEWFPKFDGKDTFNNEHKVNYKEVISHRDSLLKEACENFFLRADKKERKSFADFREKAAYWLEDYALFNACAKRIGTFNWITWDQGLESRDEETLAAYRDKYAHEIKYEEFLQFLFFSQWEELKGYCNSRGIKLIGDIPIYVTLDSADAWSHREVFQLDVKTGKPEAVSGVPPDYFSENGQRWGNPLYQWFTHTRELNEKTVLWWGKRLKHIESLFDIVRIDHFRGFESYWSIPAEENTAINGAWLPGPGKPFFDRILKSLGNLPLIAEDLGVITPEVLKLVKDLGLPGMKILQFAFDFDNNNYYLPHNLEDSNCVLYTGTHDNNTTNGWFYGPEVDDHTRKYILEYMGSGNVNDFHWQLIRLAYSSVARLVVIPAQDILGYGSEFRMNKPGTKEENWVWKLTEGALKVEAMHKLRSLAHMYKRLPQD